MKLYWSDQHELTTTVGELITELQKFDQVALVFSEGCDCIGSVVEVQTQSDGSVLLCRDDSITEKLKERYANRIQNERG